MANETVICTYRIKPDAEDEFRSLLRRHWPKLHELGGVTDEPSRIYKRIDPDDLHIIEIFTWVEGGMRVADHPDVLAIWERMEQLCESRDKRPAMSFPHYEELSILP